jgi:hypothetical protein
MESASQGAGSVNTARIFCVGMENRSRQFIKGKPIIYSTGSWFVDQISDGQFQGCRNPTKHGEGGVDSIGLYSSNIGSSQTGSFGNFCLAQEAVRPP